MNIEIILIIIGVVVTLTLAIIAFLKTKEFKVLDQELATDKEIARTEKKNFYKNFILDSVERIVVATNQVFVDELKKDKDGKLSEEDKKRAFEKTYDAVMQSLSEEGKEILNQVVGDLPFWIGQLIEAQVYDEKTIKSQKEDQTIIIETEDPEADDLKLL